MMSMCHEKGKNFILKDKFSDFTLDIYIYVRVRAGVFV